MELDSSIPATLLITEVHNLEDLIVGKCVGTSVNWLRFEMHRLKNLEVDENAFTHCSQVTIDSLPELDKLITKDGAFSNASLTIHCRLVSVLLFLFCINPLFDG